MLTLSCALVGEKGNFFAIDVNASESVDHLKDAIKRKDEKTTTCEARELELVLAKKGEAWLPDNDQAALDLEEGKVHQDIQALIDGEKMKATWTIGDVLTAKSMVGRRKAPKSKQIHVLVVVPKQVDREQWDEERARKKARSLTVIEDGRMNSIGVDLDIDMWQIGGIALNIHHVEPDFPAWLYVRKETQDITTTIRKRISVLCWWEHLGLGRAY